MNKQWQELKETITEMRDNDGTGTQQEVCKFLANYMDILEKQMQEPEHLVNESGVLVKDLVKGTIDKQAVLNKINEVCFSKEWLQFRVDNGSDGQRDFLINYIEQLPPVKPQPKVGHWISVNNGKRIILKDGMTTESVKCSECDTWLTASDEYACNGNYCPNCGAKMEGEG